MHRKALAAADTVAARTGPVRPGLVAAAGTNLEIAGGGHRALAARASRGTNGAPDAAVAPGHDRRSCPRDRTRPGGVAPPSGWARGHGKRVLEHALALAGIPLWLPLLAACALALRLTSPRGAVLAREPRIGRHGRPFDLITFRTGPAAGGQGPGGAPVPVRIAYALRRTGLEVLPGLWNVLRGDLALVGPRPEPPAWAALRQEAQPVYATRHAVLPGLTGWAQVRTRYASVGEALDMDVACDLYYVAHASPWLDLRIIGATVALIVGEGARVLAMGARRGVGLAVDRGGAWVARIGARFAGRLLPAGSCPPQAAAGVQRVLVVGAGDGGQLLVREMRRHPDWGFWPVAFVDDDPLKIGRWVDGLRVVGGAEEIPAAVQRETVDAVVIAIPAAPDVALTRIAEIARRTPARILTMPHLGALLRGEAQVLALQDVAIDDVLGRPAVTPDAARCRAFVAGRRVLITGAAGSIGQELVRQVALHEPAELVALDVNETGLFDLEQEVAELAPGVAFRAAVASVTNRARLAAIFARHRPEVVFHAAAYKHVPMMEQHPEEAVRVNAIGTARVARAAAAAGVARFVLVSTDKAVRPSSVMGASKRVAELAVKSVARETGLSACSVRFGNVLGSRGSVIPTFARQIAAGGPVTVTHKEMKRYFMTIPEAASLIIQAGAFGDEDATYLLDMGEEISIADLAARMIRLQGLRVGTDVEIVYTGLRAGEKLREELSLASEVAHPTEHPKIRLLQEAERDGLRLLPPIEQALERLAARIEGDEIAPGAHRRLLFQIVSAADGCAYDETGGPSIVETDAAG